MSVGTRLYTWLRGEKVGEDTFGNVYYRDKKAKRGYKGHPREKRWVLYNGAPEASKVPPEWHAWLHSTTEAPLEGARHDWQKPHQPNLTGTKYAHFPAGHERRGGQRAKATGDYEAWQPDMPQHPVSK